jgi:hypothetical protein
MVCLDGVLCENEACPATELLIMVTLSTASSMTGLAPYMLP